mmetsp:Transcript_2428/g.7020  ORF Transcript_2428/g.7020 Transcript_2428/m.7020 type:complete len:583 (-) Transcript_2428:236-1984(-)
MDPFGLNKMVRTPSRRTFIEYRDEEKGSNSRASVSREGVLLEYETLALRVHPPNIVVDNESNKLYTVLTIDSANRPGTLVEVVQYLTEMGLEITSARISSDGGWFVDVFYITDNGVKVRSSEKVDKLRKMLSVGTVDEGPQEECTVFELVGKDRPGLLADVTQLLTCNGCDVRSAAVWTYGIRVAFVMSVLEGGQPMKNSTKLTRLHELLLKMMGDKKDRALVAVRHVVGDVHHDRRLHQRMLEEDIYTWGMEQRLVQGGLSQSMIKRSIAAVGSHMKVVDGTTTLIQAGTSPSCSSILSNSIPEDGEVLAADVSELSANSASTALLTEAVLAERATSEVTSSAQRPPTSLPGVANGSADLLRSAKYSKPDIQVGYCNQKGYWTLNLKCKDRNKLMFDTVITLAELQYDVYHAAIDSDNGIAMQEFYMRPCNGDNRWDPQKARQLHAMLEKAVERRFPTGLKLHVHSVDRFGLLASLSRVLFESNLSIRRAVVKTHSVNNSSGHSFYVMDISGAPPDRQTVEQACHMIGGKLVEVGHSSGSSGEQIKVGSGDHKFSFSFLNRQWHKEWCGSPGSTASSMGST